MKQYKHIQEIVTLSCAITCLFTTSTMAQQVDYSLYNELFGEPVTTSANGSPQRQSEVALNMEIITDVEIKKSAARTIPELLRFVPGVDVRTHTFGQSEVSIRGYNQSGSERILVLVNGRQVYTDFFGQVIWDNIPIELNEIKQIEIVKGSNTALFGFNASSGVINIITYNPLYDDIKALSASVGTHGLREASGVLTQKFLDGRLGVKVSGGGYDTNQEFDRFSSAIEEDTKRFSGVIDVWGQVTDDVQVEFEATKNDHVRNEHTPPRAFSATEYDARSLRGRILADTSWGMWDADFYTNNVTADFSLRINDGTSNLQANNDITVAKLSNTLKWNKSHTFRVGGEYREATNFMSVPSSSVVLDQSPLTYDIWSGSVLWDYRITDKLRSSIVGRYDHFELKPQDSQFIAPGVIGAFNPSTDSDFHQKREEYSYNLGLVYQADDTNTFRASVARGVDLPSFLEFGLQFFAAPGSAPALGLYGNPNTDTSVIHNFELGYDRKVKEIGGIFKGSVFYQYNDEMQAFNADVSQRLGTDIALLGNIGDSEMYGVELGLEGVYKDKWNWGVNYTYVNIEDDIRNQQNAGVRSAPHVYEDVVASHIFNVTAGYNSEKWFAGIGAQYKSSFDDLFDDDLTTNNQLTFGEINDQVIVNANLSYNVTDNITWSVSGTSIIGNTQQYVDSDAEEVVWTNFSYRF